MRLNQFKILFTAIETSEQRNWVEILIQTIQGLNPDFVRNSNKPITNTSLIRFYLMINRFRVGSTCLSS